MSPLRMLALWLVISALVCCSSQAQPPTTHFTLSNFLFPSADLKMELDIYTPSTPGDYPVIIFISGLDGVIPGFFYRKMFTKLAELGVISVTLSKVEVIVPSWVESSVEAAVKWVQANLTEAFQRRSDTRNVNPEVADSLYLMSHSAGAHAATLYLNKSCFSVKGMIYMDPVDGIDPFGLIKIYATNPPNMLPFQLPTLIIATGFDPAAYFLLPPCAPSNLSNERFYGVLNGPTWYLNFTQYGHADALDEIWKSFATIICKSCEKNCDFQNYRESLAFAISEFVTGLHWKDETAFDYFEQPGKWKNISVSVNYKLQGFDKKGGGFCRHSTKTVDN